jgi:hypothetical protein
MPPHTIRNLSAVSRTLLIPSYSRAMESQRPDALARDAKAVELVGRLDVDFSGVQRLKDEQVNYLLRMREFDRLARAFLAEHPDGVIVDLGCDPPAQPVVLLRRARAASGRPPTDAAYPIHRQDGACRALPAWGGSRVRGAFVADSEEDPCKQDPVS